MNLKRVMTGLTHRSVKGGLVAGLLANSPRHGTGAASASVGGAEEIGAIAWSALQTFRSRANWDAAIADGDTAAWRDLTRAHFLPRDPYSQDFLEFLLMRSMIAAACAGQRVHPYQVAALGASIGTMDLSADEKMFVISEIGSPLPVSALLSYAQGPDLATLVYTASAIAANASDARGWQYLTALAAALDLPEDLVEDIHCRVERRLSPVNGASFSATFQECVHVA